ncbi:MAG TPA: sulfatase-like hydrolase/transferase [Phenylobacterium sp.]|jgi:arylsulfatase A-like enzyme
MPRPNRRALLEGGLATLTTLATGPARSASERPNILFIMADDLGFADLSCYGRRDYRTPNIDRLASEGLLFHQAYANSAVCSATRTALLTGRYQYRFTAGLQEPIAFPGFKLPEDVTTLPGLLKRAGYRTSLIGKWHLGDVPDHGPLKHGYDRFFGVPGGGSDYFSHLYNPVGPPSAIDGLWEDDHRIEKTGYLTDLFGDRAVQEIAAHRKGAQPFFMSLHFTAPHWPWEGPQDEDISKRLKDIADNSGGNLAIFAAMMRSLDDNVGKVLRALEHGGLARNTLVVFTSDNGGERFSDVWPLSGAKGELLEGGLRVPVLVRWPGRVRPGSRTDQVTITMDWLPTLLATAGVPLDGGSAMDGENLLPTLTGRPQPHPRKLFWRYKAAEQAAVRDGDWKYLKLGGKEHLFNLAQDERERAELKAAHPEILARLKADFAAWNAAMLPYPAISTSYNPKATYADRY